VADQLGITWNQAQYAATHRVTPKKRPGRPSTLDEDQVDKIELFVVSSKIGRLMSYTQLAIRFAHFNCSVEAIRSALNRRGYKRYVAHQKPPLSEKNKRQRLEWAEEHKEWTREQWYLILWTDETWITGGRHRKCYVTRKACEEWDPTCVLEKHHKKRGWMFWGSFHGKRKGPGVFWEKQWGSINKESYSEHILPIIHQYVIEHPELQLMQDHAPGHAPQHTQECMAGFGLHPIRWPAYSPDLNPIETVWCTMKDYIERKWGPDHRLSYEELRAAVLEAWESI
jgi:transposase